MTKSPARVEDLAEMQIAMSSYARAASPRAEAARTAIHRALVNPAVRSASLLANYHPLVSIHRPVGILILILVVMRFVNRRLSTLPPFLATMSSQERFIAQASEMLLYTLQFVQPLVGWGMFSSTSEDR